MPRKASGADLDDGAAAARDHPAQRGPGAVHVPRYVTAVMRSNSSARRSEKKAIAPVKALLTHRSIGPSCSST